MDLDDLLEHEMSDDCVVCRAQDIVFMALLPAAAAWEQNNELPRYSVALHGAAAMLGAMLEAGVPRDDVDAAISQLLDEVEIRIAEEQALGGPPQGTA